MDLYEFGSDYAKTYKKKCKCGRTVEVSTQKDENPEYYTEIHVRCVCGRSVVFDLPVN
jgi:hypothetical protein